MATKNGNPRNVRIFCATDNHPHCIEYRSEENPCSCVCHAQNYIPEFDLSDLALELWKIHENLKQRFTPEGVEQQQIKIIENSSKLIDLQGRTPSEILSMIKPAIEAEAWSRRELESNCYAKGFKINFYYF